MSERSTAHFNPYTDEKMHCTCCGEGQMSVGILIFLEQSSCGAELRTIKMETIKLIFSVDRKDINYLRSTLESYDGMAVVSTIDPYKAQIEIGVSPGCENFVKELLASIRDGEGLRLENE